MYSQLSVCVVDDDKSSLFTAHLMLRRLKFSRISCFTNAQQAWSYVRCSTPDLIVSDWNMEAMTGIELLARTRKRHDTRATPFVMMTANTSEDYWKQAIEAGATEFLFKPFLLDSFNAAIEIAVGHRLNANPADSISASTVNSRDQRVRA